MRTTTLILLLAVAALAAGCNTTQLQYTYTDPAGGQHSAAYRGTTAFLSKRSVKAVELSGQTNGLPAFRMEGYGHDAAEGAALLARETARGVAEGLKAAP